MRLTKLYFAQLCVWGLMWNLCYGTVVFGFGRADFDKRLDSIGQSIEPFISAVDREIRSVRKSIMDTIGIQKESIFHRNSGLQPSHNNTVDVKVIPFGTYRKGRILRFPGRLLIKGRKNISKNDPYEAPHKLDPVQKNNVTGCLVRHKVIKENKNITPETSPVSCLGKTGVTSENTNLQKHNVTPLCRCGNKHGYHEHSLRKFGSVPEYFEFSKNGEFLYRKLALIGLVVPCLLLMYTIIKLLREVISGRIEMETDGLKNTRNIKTGP